MDENLIQPITRYAVGWFTLSLIIAGVAQGKNRDGLWWWLLAILFGPVALICLLLIDKRRYNQTNQITRTKIIVEDNEIEIGPGQKVKVNDEEVVSVNGRINSRFN